MTQPEVIQQPVLNRTQRWAQLLAIVTLFVGVGTGLILKDQALSSTVAFRDLAAGILARYPEKWLLDTGGDYVLRVRDPAAGRFLTTLQVSVTSIGQDAEARNVLDTLTLQRAQTLAAFRTLRSVPFALPDGETATRFEYVYVATDANPFLEPIPVVVRGVDIVSIKRGQAIIVTFRVEADRFDDEVWRLDQFLASLEF
ncbi:MAG: hypothetical protein JXN59_08440 [Anaerolineae bacterium]|nr:hypothetical protein [Anaerolineae bacterium]